MLKCPPSPSDSESDGTMGRESPRKARPGPAWGPNGSPLSGARPGRSLSGTATEGPARAGPRAPQWGASRCEISRRGSRFWASIADVRFKLGRHRPATSESAGFGHGH